MKIFTKEMQEAIQPREVIQLLKEGNDRFVHNLKRNRDLQQQAIDALGGQYPFAVILSCIDSRTSSELIFDLGIGQIFSIRIAGNVINDDILGSMEFACKLAGTKLIVVLGHTKCGAIKGACDNAKLGNLTTLLQKIQPAVAAETTTTIDRTSHNADFVENVAALNVKHAVTEIVAKSEVLKELIDIGQIGIIGGMHDLKTGLVDFYEDTIIA